MDLNLHQEIRATIVAIDEQILAVKHHAEASGLSPFELRHLDGSWPMATLLSARANLLAGLSNMRVQTIQNNTHSTAVPPRGHW